MNAHRRFWLVGAALPLALVGCRGERHARAPQPTPQQRVAGERQVGGSAEVLQVLREARLPETFSFGGRAWRAEQVNRVDRSKVEMPGTQPSGTTGRAGTPTEPTGATGTERAAQGEGATTGQNFEYVPVLDLKTDGHQIYRNTGMTEAMKDTIFLMVEPTRQPVSRNETGDTLVFAQQGGAEQMVTMVQYNASGDLMQGMELPQELHMANLPPTIRSGGKTWQAREVQEYDADVFATLKPMPQRVMGHRAFQGDDPNRVLIESEVKGTSPSARAGETPSAAGGNTPGTETAQEGAGAAGGAGTAEGVTLSGPVFVWYEAVSGAGGAGGTSTPGTTR